MPPQRRRPVVTMSEAEFQRQVVQFATLQGWRVLHVRRSQEGSDQQWRTTTSITGWPDLFLFHPGRGGYYAAELKRNDGAVRPEQKQVIAELLAAGIPAAVWRPRDWPVIQAFLAGRTAPPFVTREENPS
jgi:hypothetical protein